MADFLRVGGGGDFTGADGPHGFVGDDGVAKVVGAEPGEGVTGLFDHIVDVGAGFADFQGFAHAHDGVQVVGQRDGGFRGDECVGFAVVFAAFGVPDHNPGDAEFAEHFGGYFTGVGAGFVLGDVLGAVGDFEFVAFDEGLHGAQVGEWYGDGNVDFFVVFLGQGECEFLHRADGLKVVEVHFPVAGDEWFTCHGQSFCVRGRRLSTANGGWVSFLVLQRRGGFCLPGIPGRHRHRWRCG